MAASLQTHVRLMYLFEPPVVYLYRRPVKVFSPRITRIGGINRDLLSLTNIPYSCYSSTYYLTRTRLRF
jgi:hypothetical protein